MGKSKTVLVRVAYLVELPEEDIISDSGILEAATNKLSKSKTFKIHDKDIKLHWNLTSSLMLENNCVNSGLCSRCGSWTTDRDKPNAVVGLSGGTIVEGTLICDQCLPPKNGIVNNSVRIHCY